MSPLWHRHSLRRRLRSSFPIQGKDSLSRPIKKYRRHIPIAKPEHRRGETFVPRVITFLFSKRATCLRRAGLKLPRISRCNFVNGGGFARVDGQARLWAACEQREKLYEIRRKTHTCVERGTEKDREKRVSEHVAPSNQRHKTKVRWETRAAVYSRIVRSKDRKKHFRSIVSYYFAFNKLK